MNPVVHFEMPFDDKAPLARFYEQAFGWQMQSMGADMGDYVLATATPSGSDGKPIGIGAINGGFFAEKPGRPAAHGGAGPATSSASSAGAGR